MIGKLTRVVPSESTYNLLLGYLGPINFSAKI